MAAETPTWIWQQPDWPDVRYDARALATDLAALAQAIGRLQGRIATLRAPDRDLDLRTVQSTAYLDRFSTKRLRAGAVNGMDADS